MLALAIRRALAHTCVPIVAVRYEFPGRLLAVVSARASLNLVMSFDILEKAINEISDKDWSWWPFLWLRPAQDARMSLPRLAAISLLYGVPFSALVMLALRHIQPFAAQQLFVAAIVFPMMFLLLGSTVVGPMWNRRAERMRIDGRRE